MGRVDDVVQMPDERAADDRGGDGREHESLLRIGVDNVVGPRGGCEFGGQSGKALSQGERRQGRTIAADFSKPGSVARFPNDETPLRQEAREIASLEQEGRGSTPGLDGVGQDEFRARHRRGVADEEHARHHAASALIGRRRGAALRS